uniref:Uncharacterized protein n=1 Tax=Opuntia streptacantha TaxID=393608 RepID=A0A7C9ACB3_OPUST
MLGGLFADNSFGNPTPSVGIFWWTSNDGSMLQLLASISFDCDNPECRFAWILAPENRSGSAQPSASSRLELIESCSIAPWKFKPLEGLVSSELLPTSELVLYMLSGGDIHPLSSVGNKATSTEDSSFSPSDSPNKFSFR